MERIGPFKSLRKPYNSRGKRTPTVYIILTYNSDILPFHTKYLYLPLNKTSHSDIEAQVRRMLF